MKPDNPPPLSLYRVSIDQCPTDKALKPLEGNSQDKGKGRKFLKRAPVAQQTTLRVDRCADVKSKGLHTAEGTITRVKRQNGGGEGISSDRG